MRNKHSGVSVGDTISGSKVLGIFSKGGRTHCNCRCACGTEYTTTPYYLRKGHTKSCGCRITEVLTIRNHESAKHGMTASEPLTMRAWNSMMQRCFNPNVKQFGYYGGRGVQPCAALRESPVNLLAVLGPRPADGSLDRYPVCNGNYDCGECDDCRARGAAKNIRWATRAQQALNRSNVCPVTARGQTMALAEWSRTLGVSIGTLWSRLERGISPERAMVSGRLPRQQRA